jgi:choline kinase
MRAVILAAGLGDRLRHRAVGLPKPLVPVGGRPLVAYTIDALAAVGASELVVVTGHRAPQVARAVQQLSPVPVRFPHNDQYEEGASLSLAAARAACGDDPFLLVMSDHLVDASLLRQLLNADPSDGAVVAADSTPRDAAYVEEATRLVVRDGRVHAIGKDLPEWDALDAGAFHCGPATWEALDRAPHDANLSQVFTILANERRLHAADVTGAFWYDVDTPEDHAAAEALLRARLAATPS